MPWFSRYAVVKMRIQAKDAEDADFKAETILEKKVVGQSYGHERNDRGEVVSYRLKGRKEGTE